MEYFVQDSAMHFQHILDTWKYWQLTNAVDFG